MSKEEQLVLRRKREPEPTGPLAELRQRRLDVTRERLTKVEGIAEARVQALATPAAPAATATPAPADAPSAAAAGAASPSAGGGVGVGIGGGGGRRRRFYSGHRSSRPEGCGGCTRT